MGVCVEGEIGFVSGASAQGCLVVTQTETGLAVTFAGGFSVARAAAGGAVIFTNAQRLEDLTGRSICASVAPETFSGAVCAGLTEDGELTRTVTVVAAVGVSAFPANFSVMVGETEVERVGSTPDWLASWLAHLPTLRGEPEECACPLDPELNDAGDVGVPVWRLHTARRRV
jgi:hypothetical protein